uniref:Uncharacterized protein n=1 Tax=Chromera velia CCMP2878 TaxID=1169474 RepID=A0A0K6SA74_9ALVE|eukprot:Cvel_1448.t3-p1 / transcript=Cvel_1448.t3 / gene=Cvel_1448 / organism=Chromera_velia_CCMP2878 / gene_product=Latent-transforming growth factor beta-binding, putative / transcript_product=Latent-transforming growth factor beta-binding, putative / location=Cvel_scaffold50:147745-154710(-) / protein_length=516 / sequence_SO=supercontig / SO=protein_coding / is_pseudo=false
MMGSPLRFRLAIDFCTHAPGNYSQYGTITSDDGSENCDINADCTNTLDTSGTRDVASFTCACNLGYRDPTAGTIGTQCDDINECQEGLDDCDPNHAHCHNNDGSFTCECHLGYHPWYPNPGAPVNGTNCYEVNECLGSTPSNVHDCDPWAVCTNTNGSFTCQCPLGFLDEIHRTGGANPAEGTLCWEINECDNSTWPANTQGFSWFSDCDVRAECANTNGSFLCNCERGYEGIGSVGNCQDWDECAVGPSNHTCNGFQTTCTNTHMSFECQCNAGYETKPGLESTDCQDINECTDLDMGAKMHDCHTNAACTNNQASFTCACLSGYEDVPGGQATGTSCRAKTCKTPTGNAAVSAPSNGNIVSQTHAGKFPDVATLSCITGYYISGTNPITCQTTGIYDDDEPSCLGVRCPAISHTAPLDVSYTNSRRYAVTSTGTATYSCDAGYDFSGTASRSCLATGAWSGLASTPTCTDINHCASAPCKNGGTCTDHLLSYSCNCATATGWTGSTCETGQRSA